MKKIILLLTLTLLGSSVSFAADPKTTEALDSYLKIQSLLAKDSFQGVTDAAKKFASDSKTLSDPKIAESLKPLIQAKDLNSARSAFEPVSKRVRDWAKKNHPKGLITAYCPMKKAYWVQTKGDLRNPFYGSEMLECGVQE